MLFVYMWCAWIVGCGTMAVASAVWRRHKARSQRIEELEAERLLYDKAGPRGINRYGLYVSPSRIAPMA